MSAINSSFGQEEKYQQLPLAPERPPVLRTARMSERLQTLQAIRERGGLEAIRQERARAIHMREIGQMAEIQAMAAALDEQERGIEEQSNAIFTQIVAIDEVAAAQQRVDGAQRQLQEVSSVMTGLQRDVTQEQQRLKQRQQAIGELAHEFAILRFAAQQGSVSPHQAPLLQIGKAGCNALAGYMSRRDQ